MPFDATALNVMLASPSDVLEECNALVAELHRWNALHSVDKKVVLLPVRWSTHSYPDLTGRAQKAINEQVLSLADLLVAVFWTRLGTPTGVEESGTVEEIKEHVKAGRPAMLYFSKRPAALESLDLDQYKKLLDFRAEMESQGLVYYYESIAQLVTDFQGHIHRQACKFSEKGDADETPGQKVHTPPLTEDERVMLKAAAQGNGHIVHAKTLGGDHFSAGKQGLGERGNHREAARWKAALLGLEDSGLIVALNSKREMFELTQAGYDLADIVS